jgi:hypothetical protein
MGQLSEAIIAYKQSPINSPKEREAKETIDRITGGQWWKDNVGTEFKWPKKHGDNRNDGFGKLAHTQSKGPWYYFQNIKTPNIYECTSKPQALLSNPDWKLIDEKR